MQIVKLFNIPSQSFIVPLNNNYYSFSIKLLSDFMVYSVYRNDEPLILGARLTNLEFLLPYQHMLDNERNNFMLLSTDNSKFDYNRFNSNQMFLIVTEEEAKRIRSVVGYK